ncbi:MAG: molybdopterin-dependent oxidoreductase [Acidimicrobiia bacterium]|nr:molybdopterin-dependent oxidoreductase [Acidimicrobiia bacterium]
MSEVTLHITGLGEAELRWQDLVALPGSVADAGTVAAGAVGLAVPVAAILDSVAVADAATHGTVISADGEYTASIPIETLRSGGWLAVGLDGGPLPRDRGGPLRLTVADGTTLCWNVKDVGSIRLTDAPEPDSVPENPPH